MAANIEIVNLSNFEKIQNFLNDTAYKEILENSENFNTRLCIERRLRMPFLDPQTGVAQTHCALFVKQKQRMPGFREGQIYTYPSNRWRKPKRQYLLNHHHSYRAYQYREAHHHQLSTSVMSRDHHPVDTAAITATEVSSLITNPGENDNKDSHQSVEKEWFHDDMELSHYHHVDDFDDEFESDNDFDESYSSRGKRKRGARARRSNTTLDGTPKRGRKGGGNRRRTTAPDGEAAAEKRRRGANTAAAAAAAAAAVASAAATASISATNSNSASPIAPIDETSQSAITMPQIPNSFEKVPDASASNDASSVMACTNVVSPVAVVAIAASPKKDGKNKMRNDREVAQPSPYCDFCLGDQRENKKTNLPEELVSCSDCGRSGHPSCLQFTPNMIISVKRYRWQCIECKYCSICGTSDNDDQLLFCDDCDRGYHMYCLSPPLITPPEGSWSCKLCLDEFHKGEKQN